MALINCPQCGKQISDRAVKCPHCGFIPGSLQIEHPTSSSAQVQQETVPKKTRNKWWVIPLVIVGISAIAVPMWFYCKEKSTSVRLDTRQQQLDYLSNNNIWRREQMPKDLQTAIYDNICNGSLSYFFTEVGNGKQVKDTLFNQGKARVNPNWTRMIEDLQFIHTEGSSVESQEIRTKIQSICNQAGCIDLTQIVQATGGLKGRIEERKYQEETPDREADLDYMKRNDIWTRINLKTEECQMLFDKIVEGDIDYLLPIAQNIDQQPKEKTNGYWIVICHEITAMVGDEAKLARTQDVLTTNCANGSINLKDLCERIRSINNPGCYDGRTLTSESSSHQYHNEYNNGGNNYVVIDGSELRLRLGPSTNADTFKWGDGTNRHPKVGEKFKYLGESGDFYQIDFHGHHLWVSKFFTHIE